MMSQLAHRYARWEVGRLLTGSLSPRAHKRLRRHLGQCPKCRAYYESAREVEDALFAPAALNPAAIERLGDLVLTPQRSSRRSWLPIAVAVLGGSAAMLTVTLRPAVTVDDDLRPRGVQTTPAPASLVLFAIDPESQSVTRLSRHAEPIAVPRGSTLQLAYRNAEYRYAAVLGIRADGVVQWYHPAEAQVLVSGGVPLVGEAIDEPFGNAWKITSPAGALRLVAFFSEEPLAAPLLEREVRQAGLRGAITLPQALADSVELEILP